jgi:hypothetical protein
MDLEDLSTTQIILLTLLVSFVTSIATGIVTVSLLAQAPPAVTNTVNQIVERTIETIVPEESGNVTTVKETTVVVKEEELITDSISKSFEKTGRVYQGVATTTSVVGLAAQLSSGAVVTDSAIVTGDHLISFGNSAAVFSVSQSFPSIGIAVLVPKNASTTAGTPFRAGDASALKLGQTSIALVSVTQERVAIGAVASRSLLAEVTKKDAPTVSIRAIDTNITASLVPGTPLVNIFGDLIGISTGASQLSGRGSFVAVSDVALLLAATGTSTAPRN